MSYSFSVTATSKDKLHDAIVDAGGKSIDSLNHGDEDAEFKAAMVEHVDRIAEAVDHVVDVLGQPGDLVRASISGHANPGHAPHEAWADECIGIYLTVEPAAG